MFVVAAAVFAAAFVGAAGGTILGMYVGGVAMVHAVKTTVAED